MLLRSQTYKGCSSLILMLPLTFSLMSNYYYVPAKWPGTHMSCGTSLPGVGKAGKPPLWKSQSIKPKGGPPGGSSLCWGLVPVWRGTLICPNGGMDQSDSAQMPKLNDIFEGLQVYYLQVQIAIPDDRDRRRQSYIAWKILEVLW